MKLRNLDASPAAPDDGAVSLTGYFIVGLRPVKIFRTEDGGLDCHALDWGTGEFIRAMDYLSRIHFSGSAEIDEVSRPQFEALVQRIALQRRSRAEPDSAALADAYADLAERMAEVGLRGHARDAADGGVEIHRRLSVTGDPDAHLPDLAHALLVAARVRLAAGVEGEVAVSRLREAAAILERSAGKAGDRGAVEDLLDRHG